VAEVVAGRSLWASLHLLDRQLVDRDGMPAGKVDDLELTLSDDADALPVLTAVLTGPAALTKRFSPRIGRAVEILRRVSDPRPEPGPGRVPSALIVDIGPAVTLSVRRAELAGNAVESFLSHHVIAHLPGAADPGEHDAAD
jgi:hypothetical protein